MGEKLKKYNVGLPSFRLMIMVRGRSECYQKTFEIILWSHNNVSKCHEMLPKVTEIRAETIIRLANGQKVEWQLFG